MVTAAHACSLLPGRSHLVCTGTYTSCEIQRTARPLPDFEPNDRLNRLQNITLYNTVIRNNSGHGISMPTNGLSKLKAPPLVSQPAFAPSSFVFENLLIDGGGEGGIYWDNMGEKTAAGQLLVRNATIRHTAQAGLQVSLGH